MIFGLSHIGMTVRELDDSLSYYQKTFDFTVLSDAERKGEWIDKITGIPGFHTRTVYLSVSPYNHLELFGFFHPKTFSVEKDVFPRVGISYCAFERKESENLSELAASGEEQEWSNTIGDIGEEGTQGCRVVVLQDPDGLNLKIVAPRNEETGSQDSSGHRLLHAGVIVENIESSLKFYRDVLGLEIAKQEGPFREENSLEQDEGKGSAQSLLLESVTGMCLKLIQPLNTKILPAHPWRMERIGFTHVAFAVANLEKHYRQLTKSKVNFLSSPQSVTAGPHKGGRAVYLSTPEGITLEFIDSPLTHEQAAEVCPAKWTSGSY